MKDSQWIFFLPNQDLFQPYSTSLLPAASTHSLVQIWLWQQSSQLLLIIITGHKDLPCLNVSKNAYRVLWLFFFHATSYGSSLFFLWLLPLSLFCGGWRSFLSTHHLSFHTPFFQWSKPVPLFASLLADLFICFSSMIAPSTYTII